MNLESTEFKKLNQLCLIWYNIYPVSQARNPWVVYYILFIVYITYYLYVINNI